MAPEEPTEPLEPAAEDQVAPEVEALMAAPEAVVELEATAEPEVVAAPEAAVELEAPAEPEVVAAPEAVVELEAPAEPEVVAAPEVVAEAPTGDDPRSQKLRIVLEAEKLAESSAWSKVSIAFRELLERWRGVGSAGREADDQLWQRFATARDTFYERRNHAYADRARHAAEASEQKRQLIAEAETLLDSTSAREITDGLKRLMEQWKAAGRAGSEEDALWAEFRTARERAFQLRSEILAARDRTFDANKAEKLALIERARDVSRQLPADELEVEIEAQMTAWKAIGSAGRKPDEELWEAFRAARGPLFGRVRQLASQRERTRDNARSSAGRALETAERLAFSDGPVAPDEMQKIERAMERAGDDLSSEQRSQFNAALDRIRPRVTTGQPAASVSSPLAIARAKQEQAIRDLEERVTNLKGAGNDREAARTAKRLDDEREKLAKMAAFLDAAGV